MSENKPVTKLARLRSKAGQASFLKDALLLLERETRAEPGCLEFSFFQALSDEESFVLLEQFTTETALLKHMQAVHTRDFFALNLVDKVVVADL